MSNPTLSPAAPSSHYFVNGRTVRLFDLVNCDKCKKVVRACNEIGGSIRDVAKYDQLGMISAKKMPDETIELSADGEGDAWCESCNYDHDAATPVESTARPTWTEVGG